MRNESMDYVVSVGMVLADDMQAMGITQTALATQIGISKSIINEILKGKRKMSQEVAIKLEPIFGVPAQYWLNIQNDYDIASKKSEMYLIGKDKVIETGRYSALDIAHWLINRAARDVESTGEYITNLKLQKLLFLVQSRSIKKASKAVFVEPILHWEYGPVVQSVYNAYKSYGANSIKKAATVEFDRDTERLLESVYKFYENYSTTGLVTVTHKRNSWLMTKQGEEMTLEMISQDI